MLTLGSVRLDAAQQRAFRGERELRLTLKEFAVLRYLLRHPGNLVSSEELLEHVWDENADPFTQTVRVTVGHAAAQAEPSTTNPSCWRP